MCHVKVRDKEGRKPLSDLPTPATFAEGRKAIDLNRFPRMDGATAGAGSSSNLRYEAPGNVTQALAFYREKLAAQGWTEDGSGSDVGEFGNAAFIKDGFYLSCHASKIENAKLVGVHIENKGNFEVRQLPRPSGSTEGGMDDRDEIRFETKTSLQGVADFYKAELSKHGWKEFESKDHASGGKLLVMIHGAVTLKIDIDERGTRIRSEMFGVYIPTPSTEQAAQRILDLSRFPKLTGAAEVRADWSGLEYVAGGNVVDAIRFHRAEFAKKGWSEQLADDKVLRFAKERFLVEAAIVAKDGGGVTVKLRNRGDLDARTFLHLEDAEIDPASTQENAKYSTASSVDSALDFHRRELPKFGWRESTDAVGDKMLIFTRNAMRLEVEVSTMNGKTAVQLRTWSNAKEK